MFVGDPTSASEALVAALATHGYAPVASSAGAGRLRPLPALIDATLPGLAARDVCATLFEHRLAFSSVAVLVPADAPELHDALRGAGVAELVTMPASAATVAGALDRAQCTAMAISRPWVEVEEPPHYCSRCGSLTERTHFSCMACGAPADDGWPQADDVAHRRLGGSLGPYRLLQVLGVGSSAVVYRAVHETCERSVAVKLLSTVRMGQQESFELVRNEAGVLAQIHSTHIMTVRDLLMDDAHLAVVMDLAEGQNLADYVVDHGPLPLDRAIEVTSQLAEAIQHAHDLGIVHRDIKPSNVHIQPLPDGGFHASLVDFGIACVMFHNDHREQFHGTPAYAAPEQLEAPGLVDGRADVYGLAGVLYYAITGERPFEGPNDIAIFRRKLSTPFPLLSVAETPYSRGLCDRINVVLRSMGTRDLTERPHSAAHVSATLRALLHGARAEREGQEETRRRLLRGELAGEARAAALHTERRRLLARVNHLSRHFNLAKAALRSAAGDRSRHHASSRRLEMLRLKSAAIHRELERLRGLTAHRDS